VPIRWEAFDLMVADDPERRPLLDARISLAEAFGEIAVAAGREILRIRARAPMVRAKADASPYTAIQARNSLSDASRRDRSSRRRASASRISICSCCFFI
jgi:hypothetical protein